MSFEFLKDVLVLLALCVEHRSDRYGLHGNGVNLKITYGDMKSITRSRLVPYCDSASLIYKNAVQLLEGVERGPVRLVGAGIYNLSGEEDRQLTIEDLISDDSEQNNSSMADLLQRLQNKYHLDFAGNLDKIYKMDILHRTVEFMRKH